MRRLVWLHVAGQFAGCSAWLSRVLRLGAESVTNHAVRLGLRMARGLSERDGSSLVAARGTRPYQTIPEIARRAGIGTGALVRLAKADAFAAFGLSRRQASWAIKGLRDEALPLFEAAEQRAQEIIPEQIEEEISLPAMTRGREVVEEKCAPFLSLQGTRVL